METVQEPGEGAPSGNYHLDLEKRINEVLFQVIRRLKESAKTSPNRAGSVFAYDEFRRLLTTSFKESGGLDLIEYVMLRFSAVTLLLGALRSEQFNRFREGGLKSVEVLRDNIDNEGNLRPVDFNVSVKQEVKQNEKLWKQRPSTTESRTATAPTPPTRTRTSNSRWCACVLTGTSQSGAAPGRVWLGKVR